MTMTENRLNDIEEKNSSKDFLVGAIIGGVVGAAAALLLAPKTGKELRNDLSGQMDSLMNKTDQWREVAGQKSNQFAAAAMEKTGQMKDMALEKGNQLVGVVKEKTQQVKEQVPEASKDTTDEMQSAAIDE
jgi:gas vesicle protein